LNVWTFTGNLGRDCEQATTQSGMAICTFAVAVTSGYGDRKQTTWVKVKLFGKQAEGGLPQYLVKGQQVAVSGEATLAEWEKKDGSKGYTLEVVAHQVDLIGKRDDSQGFQKQAPQQQYQPQAQQAYQAPQQQYQPPQVGGPMFPQGQQRQQYNPAPVAIDDEIPF